jgi:Protein of unknown function (DUF938)
MTQPDYSAAADRNKQAILEVLLKVLPERGNALEIASGTGQHVAWFASGLPGWDWQPSDAQPDGFASINAWVAEQGVRNVHSPVVIDVMATRWLPGQQQFGLIYCANMLHIAPWATCTALMRGSAQHLAPGGRLITYGPYFEDDVPASPGNLSFDESLRERNPAWGIRRIEEVKVQAAKAGLSLAARHTMPANNLLLVWTHRQTNV